MAFVDDLSMNETTTSNYQPSILINNLANSMDECIASLIQSGQPTFPSTFTIIE